MFVWILIGITLLILEILSTTFFILFFGLSALTVAAALYVFFFPVHYQLLCFAVCAVFYFIIFRKLFKKRKKAPEIQNELIGQIAFVHETIQPLQLGKVILGDTCWNATSETHIQKGAKVKILSHNNLTLEVTPL